ncbi:MAG: hypothetical protein KZQ95_00920 [Candidatus Thiodiazotropha sp. (ex Epidulcina cf. delphinae)]|nr:hypothetical protein [Candidatus Thiodiazotropha sp. (ex Epidulcina cf. delphinae)]
MEVFITSVMVNTASAAVVHNHPPGDPEPSQSDIHFTHRNTHKLAVSYAASVFVSGSTY